MPKFDNLFVITYLASYSLLPNAEKLSSCIRSCREASVLLCSGPPLASQRASTLISLVLSSTKCYFHIVTNKQDEVTAHMVSLKALDFTSLVMKHYTPKCKFIETDIEFREEPTTE